VLSASIAHEISQPLSAIQNFVAAAEITLSRQPLNLPVLKEMIAGIRDSDNLATKIVFHLRSLLRNTDGIDLVALDLDNVIDAALNILRPEAIMRQVSISVQKGGSFRRIPNSNHLRCLCDD